MKLDVKKDLQNKSQDINPLIFCGSGCVIGCSNSCTSCEGCRALKW